MLRLSSPRVAWGAPRWGFPSGVAEIPDDIVKSLNLDLAGNFSLNLNGITVLTAIALVISVMPSNFDTMGTVIGIAGEAGQLDEQGRLPGIFARSLTGEWTGRTGRAGSGAAGPRRTGRRYRVRRCSSSGSDGRGGGSPTGSGPAATVPRGIHSSARPRASRVSSLQNREEEIQHEP